MLEFLQIAGCLLDNPAFATPARHVEQRHSFYSPCGLQVVLGSLKQQCCDPSPKLSSAKTLKALEYFGIPQQLWPVGLQLVQRAKQQMQTTVKDLVDQMCTVALTMSPGGVCRAIHQDEITTLFEESFIVTSYDDASGKAAVELYNPSLKQEGLTLPPFLIAAVVATGKPSFLIIKCENRFRAAIDWMTVIKVQATHI